MVAFDDFSDEIKSYSRDESAAEEALKPFLDGEMKEKKPFVLSITCPGNVIQNISTGMCSAVVTGIGPSSVLHDFGIDSISYILTGATTGNGLNDASGTFNIGVTTVTYTITELGGLTSSCSFTVEVIDNVNPTITCRSDTIVDVNPGFCFATVPSGLAPLSVGDNCSFSVSYLFTGVSTGAGSTDASGRNFNLGVTTVNYTITDLSGNSRACSFTVTARETIAPAISCPVDRDEYVDASCNFTIPDYTGMATGISDNCSATGAISLTQSPVVGSLISGHGTSQTIQLYATDPSGNIDSCSFVITLLDTIKPTLICPGNQSVNTDVSSCGAIVNGIAPVAENDNCIPYNVSYVLTGATTGAGLIDASGTLFNEGVTTVTYTIVDGAGNRDSCDFTVTVNDIENPVITCRLDTTVDNNSGACFATVNGLAPQLVGDNCGGAASVGYVFAGVSTGSGSNDASGRNFNLGVTTVNYTATDSSGNTATCSFTVTVVDAEPPSISCPGNQTVTNNVGFCSAIVNGIAPVAENDNCLSYSTNYVLTGATIGSGLSDASGVTFNEGVTTVTYIIIDNAGNRDSCSFTVTVNDTELPSISCPPNQVLNNDLGVCGAVVNGIAPLTASDNCGIDSVSYVLTGATTGNGLNDASGLTFSPGTTTITYTITDSSGNRDSCDFTVTINDNENPIVTCRLDTVLNNDLGVCGAIVNNIPPISTSDNCEIDSVSYVLTGATIGSGLSDASGLIFNVGATTVTYTITDTLGNTNSCSFMVTVNDVENPVIICRSDTAVDNNSGVCFATVNGLAPLLTDDTCGVATVSYIFSGVSTGSGLNDASGRNFNLGVTTVNYTVTDLSGNTAACSFTVTVLDAESPSISCPGNIVTNNDTLICGAVVNGIAPLTANDNCGIDSVSYVLSGATIGNGLNDASGLTFNLGVTTVTYRVTDNSSNIDSCSFTITVIDNEVPSFNCPANKDEYLNSTCNFTIPDYTTTITGLTDNCPPLSSIVVTQSPPIGTIILGHGIVQPITIYATDASGNTDSCIFDVQLLDTIKPTMVCTSSFTISNDLGLCGAAVTGLLPASIENCSIDSISYVLTGATTGSGLNDASGFYDAGTTSVAYTIVDSAGNMNTCSFDVTVNDGENPIIACHPDTILNNDPGLCGAVVNGIAPLNINDNCLIDSVSYLLTGVTTGSGLNDASGFYNVGVTTVTYSITDTAGNVSSCFFTVTVNDNETPSFNCPANRAEYLDSVCNFIIPDYSTILTGLTDNCTPVSSLIITQSPAIGTVLSGHGTVQSIQLYVADASNNIDSLCSFTITLQDTIKPIFICPGITEIALDSNCQVLLDSFAVVTDNCNSFLSITQTPPVGNLYTAEITGFGIPVMMTADDGNGNSSTCSFQLTIADTLAPTIICPNDTIVYASSNCDAFLTLDPPFIEDNCSGIDTLSTGYESFLDTSSTAYITGDLNNTSGTYLGGVTTVVWTAVDNSFKVTESSCFYTITVLDTTPPVISCVNSFSVNVDSDSCSAVVSYNAPTATDSNCPNNLVVTQIAGLPDNAVFPVGVTTNTFVATNDVGLTDTCSFTITVVDNEAPSVSCPNDIVVCDDVNVTVPLVGTSDNCAVVSIVNDFNSTADASGIYPVGITTVNWTVADAEGNTSSCFITVEVVPSASIAEAGDDQVILLNQTTNLEGNVPSAGEGVWSLISGTATIDDINDPLSLISNLTRGDNIFRWTIENPPCPDTFDEVTIVVNGAEIPSGFSPNNDGDNDLFIIPELAENNEVLIFNRWGNEVFSARNYQNDWDGTSNDGKTLPDDTYFYLVKLLDFGEEFNGFVVIKR